MCIVLRIWKCNPKDKKWSISWKLLKFLPRFFPVRYSNVTWIAFCSVNSVIEKFGRYLLNPLLTKESCRHSQEDHFHQIIISSVPGLATNHFGACRSSKWNYKTRNQFSQHFSYCHKPFFLLLVAICHNAEIISSDDRGTI